MLMELVVWDKKKLILERNFEFFFFFNFEILNIPTNYFISHNFNAQKSEVTELSLTFSL